MATMSDDDGEDKQKSEQPARRYLSTPATQAATNGIRGKVFHSAIVTGATEYSAWTISILGSADLKCTLHAAMFDDCESFPNLYRLFQSTLTRL